MRWSALIAALACTALLSATGASAQSTAPAADFPVAVDLPAGAYQLDPRHASVLFRIQHGGLAWFTARFDTKAATLTLDPADPSHSQLSASIDATSVNTGVLNTQGERSFDQSIGRALGAGQISFTSTAIGNWAKANLAAGATVASDGLACFAAVVEPGCTHVPMVRW